MSDLAGNLEDRFSHNGAHMQPLNAKLSGCRVLIDLYVLNGI